MACFFEGLHDNKEDVLKNAEGATWQCDHWPLKAEGELISALDGDWSSLEKYLGDKLREKAITGAAQKGKTSSEQDIIRATRDSVHAIMMIRAFRARGHLRAKLDPLQLAEKQEDYKELSPEAYGFTPADYERLIFIDNVLGLEYATIPQMLEILNRTYCSTIGVEYMHVSDPVQKAWLQERIEGRDKRISFTQQDKKAILDKLIQAEGFEQFLDTKYKGTKRFGLDGGEALIPALEQIIKCGSALGVREVILGMAHRGRLNVLSQVLAKPHRAIFHEFKGGLISLMMWRGPVMSNIIWELQLILNLMVKKFIYRCWLIHLILRLLIRLLWGKHVLNKINLWDLRIQIYSH